MEIPKDLTYKVDVDHFGSSINPANPSHLTEHKLNGYVCLRIRSYQRDKWTQQLLWETVKEDFEGFTLEILSIVSREALRDLRDCLICRDVWVKPARGSNSYARVFNELLNEEIPAEWTDERRAEQEAIRSKKYYQPVLQPKQSPSVQQPIIQQPISQQQQQPMNWQLPGPQIQPIGYQPTYQQVPPPPMAQQFGQQSNYQPERRTDYQLEVTPGTAKQLTELTKFYTEDKKYGGDIYDVLANKLKIFRDCCKKIGLQDLAAAYSIMLKGNAADFYYDQLVDKDLSYEQLVHFTQRHFETEEKHQQYLTEWMDVKLSHVITENPDISKSQCLDKVLQKLQTLQKGLDLSYQNDRTLRDRVIAATRGVPECDLALFNAAPTYEGVCAQLRSAIATATLSHQHQPTQYAYGDTQKAYEDTQYAYDRAYWTDRTYKRGGSRGYNRGGGGRGRGGFQGKPKKCYICDKDGCWSTKHTLQERKEAYAKFKQNARKSGAPQDISYFQSFLTNYEGHEDLESHEDVEEEEPADFARLQIEESDQFFTSFGSIDGVSVVSALNDQSVHHAVTKVDVFDPSGGSSAPESRNGEIFTFDRYGDQVFQGIMPDTGAAGVSTAGEPQFQALRQADDSIQLDTSTAGQHSVRFGKGSATSLGHTVVKTPIGPIIFHIVPANTPFLLCLGDMDRLGVKLDNINDMLIQGQKQVPIVRKWGHPWLLLGNDLDKSVAYSHLTETELRQLHRRFGHPSALKLANMLCKAGHDVQSKLLKDLTKYCHSCQMHQASPGRFRFNLKDDSIDFNSAIIIDVLYLAGKPVLQVVDAATSFQAARFLKDMSAKAVWETLKICWIDTYLGPPEQVVHDAGKNFASAEFRQNAGIMAIETKEVPVESHNSIGKVERYHAPLRRAFDIICMECTYISHEAALQMAVKAINDTAGPNGLVPTLLVFGAYPRVSYDSPPSASIAQRAEAIRKAMKEIKRLQATRQVNDALRMRNGPDTLPVTTLPIQSEVIVWREKAENGRPGWTGPYKLLAVDEQTCTIDMPSGPTNFRSTTVRPYYRGNLEDMPPPNHEDLHEGEDRQSDEDWNPPLSTPPRRGRGRPKGSKNRPKGSMNLPNPVLQEEETFISIKEEKDLELSKQFRKEGKIITPGAPFEAATKKEIDALIARGVFKFEQFDPKVHGGTRIFRSRIVNEVKGKATNSPYEKSRLVVQGYNDSEKEAILTQSPTIQRASQRLMVAVAASLINSPKQNISLQLRDITQAYVQSETCLNRIILASLPAPLRNKHPQGTIMRVMKPLYGIAEAGTHWWATYSRHHIKKLSMMTSSFDPCLLISNSDLFGIVGLQTDDTLICGDEGFQDLEQEKLQEAGFTAKNKEKLAPDTPLLFNGCVLSIKDDVLTIRQKDQGKKIIPVENNKGKEEASIHQQFIEQRARGAYIASICQPEASFDLSIAAQHQDPNSEEVKALNKRLVWQRENVTRGLNYLPLDLSKSKLYVFVDGSFANNKDFTSQLGYIIVLATENVNEAVNTFNIKGNIIHWSSTKCKRVTRSVLASEIYGMVAGADVGHVLGTTLEMIMKKLNLPPIQQVLCTDSYSLYECLVKLGTTKEKRLMIDIMALRQSYERREFEVKWINGGDNPADAMTKASPNAALCTLIDTNQLNVRVEGWVKRSE